MKKSLGNPALNTLIKNNFKSLPCSELEGEFPVSRGDMNPVETVEVGDGATKLLVWGFCCWGCGDHCCCGDCLATWNCCWWLPW